MSENKIASPETSAAEKVKPNAVPSTAEEISPLAHGLPDWTIEPPVIAIRRKPKAS